MQPRSVLLIVACLFILFAGCRKKKEDEMVRIPLIKDVKGVVVYSSCAATVVRATNMQLGTSWTNCHNETRYEHVFDAWIVNADRQLEVGEVINFDVVEDEPISRCKIAECGPSLIATVVLK